MKDKVVIITGASSGIGLALANELAARGAVLSLAARNTEKLEEMVNQYSRQGVRAIAVPTDVSREEDCKGLVQKTVDAFGRIDILINNAGISMRALFEKTDLAVIRRLMDVNFWGTVYCTKYALPWLLKTKGSLVGVSSIAGYKGLPGRTGYSASKYAIQGFLETVRIENMKKGLHVLIACPGFTSSNIRNSALSADGSLQGESPRNEDSMMKPEKVAVKIADAIKRKNKILVMTIVGKLTVALDKIFPFFMDRMVYNQMAKEPDSPFK